MRKEEGEMRQLHWLSVKLAIDCLQLVRVQRVCSARESERANKEIRIKGILSAHAGHLPLSQLCAFCHATLLGHSGKNLGP